MRRWLKPTLLLLVVASGLGILLVSGPLIKVVPADTVDVLQCDITPSEAVGFQAIIKRIPPTQGFAFLKPASDLNGEDLTYHQMFRRSDLSMILVDPDYSSDLFHLELPLSVDPIGDKKEVIAGYTRQYISFAHYPKGPSMAQVVKEVHQGLKDFHCVSLGGH